MFAGIGMSEILLIVLVALVVIGPEKLPQMARMLGKGLRELRRASNLFRDMFMLEEPDDHRRQHRRNDQRQHPNQANTGADSESPGSDSSGHAAANQPVIGTIDRSQPAGGAEFRPVLLAPCRRARDIDRVDLEACRVADATTTAHQLTAPPHE